VIQICRESRRSYPTERGPQLAEELSAHRESALNSETQQRTIGDAVCRSDEEIRPLASPRAAGARPRWASHSARGLFANQPAHRVFGARQAQLVGSSYFPWARKALRAGPCRAYPFGPASLPRVRHHDQAGNRRSQPPRHHRRVRSRSQPPTTISSRAVETATRHIASHHRTPPGADSSRHTQNE
jgi:hypothetical protein